MSFLNKEPDTWQAPGNVIIQPIHVISTVTSANNPCNFLGSLGSCKPSHCSCSDSKTLKFLVFVGSVHLPSVCSQQLQISCGHTHSCSPHIIPVPSLLRFFPTSLLAIFFPTTQLSLVFMPHRSMTLNHGSWVYIAPTSMPVLSKG